MNKFAGYLYRNLYCVTGGIMILCAFIGIFLPVVPAVPFLIAAAWCLSRSSPVFSRWLHDQPVFGPPSGQQEKALSA
jgi:uncharacterized membrane protein YbaN (DUF454 family)